MTLCGFFFAPPKMKVKGYMYPQMKKPVGMLSTNKSDRHDIAEILLKVVLYSITITLNSYEVYIKAVLNSSCVYNMH